jgi:hypothetical protein
MDPGEDGWDLSLIARSIDPSLALLCVGSGDHDLDACKHVINGLRCESEEVGNVRSDVCRGQLPVQMVSKGFRFRPTKVLGAQLMPSEVLELQAVHIEDGEGSNPDVRKVAQDA